MTEQFTFAAPVIEPMPLFLGMAGDTGTGKTFSAMRVMRGIVGSDDFAVIDTEQGRAGHYHKSRLGARGFDFISCRLDAPYSPARYRAATEAAMRTGVKGLIIDSGSHLWESEGGVQDVADRAAKKLAQKWQTTPDKTSFAAWREPKDDMWQLVWFWDKAPIHIIICFRAKVKNKQIKDERGRSQIVNVGYQPIIEHGVPFQLQFCALFEPDAPGVPRWTVKPLAEQFKGWLDQGKQIGEEDGKRLAKWAAGPEAQQAKGGAPQRERAPEPGHDPKTGEIDEPPANGNGHAKRKTLPLFYRGEELEDHPDGPSWRAALLEYWEKDREGIGASENLTLLRKMLARMAPDAEDREVWERLALDMAEDLSVEGTLV